MIKHVPEGCTSSAQHILICRWLLVSQNEIYGYYKYDQNFPMILMSSPHADCPPINKRQRPEPQVTQNGPDKGTSSSGLTGIVIVIHYQLLLLY